MKQHQPLLVRLAMAGLLVSGILPTAAQAETGHVRVVFTKGGFIVGVGGGEGVLTFRGHHYRFNVSGMSVGFTVGASTTRLSMPGNGTPSACQRSSPGSDGRPIAWPMHSESPKTRTTLKPNRFSASS